MKTHATAAPNVAPLLEGDTVEVTKQGIYDGISGIIIAKNITLITVELPSGDTPTFFLKDVRRVGTPTTGVELRECADSEL